ncbi:hypothetical protein JL720_4566 [Aureococcus anophagefferens]|nr:hypothetical protein JL720_4566 [Aureococcus anophagefferens]
MRVETLCEGQWLASSTFCELPVGKRVAICMLLFTAVMLSDLVLAALRVATRAAVVATRRGRGAASDRRLRYGRVPRRRRGVSPDDGVGVEESKGGEFGVGVEESKGAEPFEETPSESTEGSSLGAEAPSSSSGRFSSLGTEEEDKLYASLDAELSTAQRRGAARVPALLLALVALVVLTTAAEVGWLVYEHVRRSAAVRRALETAIVLRVCRAVHETQRERGLLSTCVASGRRERARARQQFLRTDAALDLAVGAALRHADTVRVAGARSGDTDLSPSRTASLLYGAVGVGAAGLSAGRGAGLRAPRGAPPPPRGDGAARGDAAAPDDHLVADAYSALNENLLTVARDAAVELMRAGLRAQHLAPSLESSLQSFLALAPKRFVSAYAPRASTASTRPPRSAAASSPTTRTTRTTRVRALQSCRIDSLQAMMDDLQAAILADRRAAGALWRLLYLGAARGVLLAGAYLGLLGLVAFVRYQESVAERLDRLRSAERKYKKLLATWVPLKERIAGAAPPNEAA